MVQKENTQVRVSSVGQAGLSTFYSVLIIVILAVVIGYLLGKANIF